MDIKVRRASFSGADAKKKAKVVQSPQKSSVKINNDQAESTGKKKAAKKSKVASKDLATLSEISALVSAEENPSEVLSIINQYKTKSSIANGLSKLYKDTKKSSAVYKKLKPLLKEKNKS